MYISSVFEFWDSKTVVKIFRSADPPASLTNEQICDMKRESGFNLSFPAKITRKTAWPFSSLRSCKAIQSYRRSLICSKSRLVFRHFK